MRFVCDSCRAQYMISDDKVGPKGVKVRCKKCSYVILVRRPEAGAPDEAQATQVMENPLAQQSDPGNQQTEAHVPAAEADPMFKGVEEDEIGAVFDQVLAGKKSPHGDSSSSDGAELGANADDRMSTRVLDAELVKKLAQEAGEGPAEPPPEPKYDWYVAIDDKQVGPLSEERLKEQWNRGEIGPDSLCWRAGLGDWTPLSEVAELASVLAPRPGKPVIVAPSPVVSVQVESAFNAGGVSKSMRGEMQVPVGGSPAEETSGGWKPSAASALASLVKEEISALSKPPALNGNHDSGGLLDLPPPAEERNGKNGMHAPVPNGEPFRHEPMAAYAPPLQPYAPPAPVYSPPPSSNRRGLVIGLSVAGGVVVLGLLGALVYLAARPPVVVQPPPVAQAPIAPAPVAPAPVAAAPAPTPTPTPAPTPPPAAAAAEPTPPPAAAEPAALPPAPKVASAASAAPSASRSSRGASSSSGSSRSRRDDDRDERPAREERPTRPSAPEPSGDEFDAVFGSSGGGKRASASDSDRGGDSRKRSVYVPPPPGGGADLPETLGQSDIMQVVLGSRAALAQCANEQRKKNPDVRGKLVMQWSIQTNGRTSNVSVAPESDEFRSSHMASCVGGLIKRWTFPRHKVKGDLVKFPFTF